MCVLPWLDSVTQHDGYLCFRKVCPGVLISSYCKTVTDRDLQGSLGDVVVSSAETAGVDMSSVVRDTSPEAEVGIFTVLPEKQTVHYQVATSLSSSLTAR